MLEKFEHDGCWWLPDNPDKQFRGKITYDPYAGTTLVLYNTSHWEHGTQHNTVLGQLDDNRKVTLSHAIIESCTCTKCRISPLYMLINAHLESPCFCEIEVSYSYLEVWTENKNKDIDLGKIENSCLEIAESSNNVRTLRITNDGGQNLRDLVKIAVRFQSFLTFATQLSCYAKQVRARVANNLDTYIDVYLQPDFFRDSYPTPSRPKILLPYAIVQDSIQTIMQKWFAMSEEIETVLELYLSNLYHEKQYLRSEFLNVVQAIEVFHRERRDNTRECPEKHEHRMERILKKFQDPKEDNLGKWLQEELKYSNEPSLRTRLKALYKEFSTTMHYYTGEKVHEFADKVLNTRDELTHQGQAKTDGDTLWKYSMRLHILLTCCLLKELEIAPHIIAHVIRFFSYLK